MAVCLLGSVLYFQSSTLLKARRTQLRSLDCCVHLPHKISIAAFDLLVLTILMKIMKIPPTRAKRKNTLGRQLGQSTGKTMIAMTACGTQALKTPKPMLKEARKKTEKGNCTYFTELEFLSEESHIVQKKYCSSLPRDSSYQTISYRPRWIRL